MLNENETRRSKLNTEIVYKANTYVRSESREQPAISFILSHILSRSRHVNILKQMSFKIYRSNTRSLYFKIATSIKLRASLNCVLFILYSFFLRARRARLEHIVDIVLEDFLRNCVNRLHFISLTKTWAKHFVGETVCGTFSVLFMSLLCLLNQQMKLCVYLINTTAGRMD